MRELGIAGVGTPAKKPRTTAAGAVEHPTDLLERVFDAERPNERWVADITYVPTASGWHYTAFVMDCYSRGIVGWAVADHLRAELALDALEMGIWTRKHRIDGNLVHHSSVHTRPIIDQLWEQNLRQFKKAMLDTRREMLIREFVLKHHGLYPGGPEKVDRPDSAGSYWGTAIPLFPAFVVAVAVWLSAGYGELHEFYGGGGVEVDLPGRYA